MADVSETVQSLSGIALSVCTKNADTALRNHLDQVPLTLLEKLAKACFSETEISEMTLIEFFHSWPTRIFSSRQLQFTFDANKVNILKQVLDSGGTGNIEEIHVDPSPLCPKAALHDLVEYVAQGIELVLEHEQKDAVVNMVILLNLHNIIAFDMHHDKDMYAKLQHLIDLQRRCQEACRSPGLTLHVNRLTVHSSKMSRCLFYSIDMRFLRKLEFQLVGTSKEDICQLLISLKKAPALQAVQFWGLPKNEKIKGLMIDCFQNMEKLEEFAISGDAHEYVSCLKAPNAAMIREICSSGLQSDKIKSLRLPFCIVSKTVLQHIAKNENLHKLNELELYGCRELTYCSELCNVLSLNAETLCSLDLAENRLTLAQVIEMIPVFLKLKNLRYLFLVSENFLEEDTLMSEVYPHLKVLPYLMPLRKTYDIHYDF